MAIEVPCVSINDEELLVEWFGRVIICVNDEGAACCFVRQGHYVPHTAVDWPTALAELRRLIRTERDNIAALNSSLIAKLAEAKAALKHEADCVEAAKARIAELAKRRNEQFGRAERAEARIAERQYTNEFVDDLYAKYRLIVDERNKANARIAELEQDLTYGHEAGPFRAMRARAERAEARVAGLEATNRRSLEAHYLVCKQAERAEAALSFYADESSWHTAPHCYSAAVSDCGTKARAARSPSPAGPDGKSLAVLYCMDRAEEDVKLLREALEGMIAVAEGRFDGNPHADIDTLAKARAALAPSPAGRDCGCEDASKCWGGSPGIKCRRPFPSPAGREG